MPALGSKYSEEQCSQGRPGSCVGIGVSVSVVAIDPRVSEDLARH